MSSWQAIIRITQQAGLQMGHNASHHKENVMAELKLRERVRIKETDGGMEKRREERCFHFFLAVRGIA